MRKRRLPVLLAWVGLRSLEVTSAPETCTQNVYWGVLSGGSPEEVRKPDLGRGEAGPLGQSSVPPHRGVRGESVSCQGTCSQQLGDGSVFPEGRHWLEHTACLHLPSAFCLLFLGCIISNPYVREMRQLKGIKAEEFTQDRTACYPRSMVGRVGG